eukprot:COSAG04_NODE_4882_length_1846_cov_4.194047_1_plen_208_part_10
MSMAHSFLAMRCSLLSLAGCCRSVAFRASSSARTRSSDAFAAASSFACQQDRMRILLSRWQRRANVVGTVVGGCVPWPRRLARPFRGAVRTSWLWSAPAPARAPSRQPPPAPPPAPPPPARPPHPHRHRQLPPLPAAPAPAPAPAPAGAGARARAPPPPPPPARAPAPPAPAPAPAAPAPRLGCRSLRRTTLPPPRTPPPRPRRCRRQ